MNKQIEIQDNQTLWDISLQEYGSIEAIFLVLQANPLLSVDSEVAPGQKILIPKVEPINKKVYEFYNTLNYSPASGSFIFTPTIIPPPTPPPNPGVDAIVHNSDNSLNTTVPSGGTLNLTDSVITINGVLLSNLPATNDLDIEVVNGNNQPIGSIINNKVVFDDNWVRPTHWPVQPSPNYEEVSLLLRLEGNYDIENIFHIKPRGNCEVWVDNVMIDANLPDNLSREYKLNSLNYGFFKDGIKWCWVQIRPQTGSNIKTLDFSTTTAGYNNSMTTNFVEMIINMPHHDNYFSPITMPDANGGGTITFHSLQHIQFNDVSEIHNIHRLFAYLNGINHISNLPDLTNVTSAGLALRMTPSPITEFNLSSVTTLAYMFERGALPQQLIKINTTGALVSLQNFSAHNSRNHGYEISDCSNVTNASFAFYNNRNARRIICNNLSVNVDIRYCYALTEQALLDFINSLKDLTGLTSQTIQMSGITSHASVNSLASSKNWIITY